MFVLNVSALYACMPADPIIDGCKLPCGCWELNSGLLEEWPVLLASEASLQLQERLHAFISFQNPSALFLLILSLCKNTEEVILQPLG